MQRTIKAILGLTAATWLTWVHADVTVLAIRLGAKDVVALAKFYDAAFGLKEIDRVGKPPTEIIMRYGATVAAAKAGASPEFLVARRDPGAAIDPITHAIFHVSDIDATVRAAKAAGATVKGDVAAVSIGGMSLKSATLVDPDGNVLELMQLPKGVSHLQHP
ncbi:MAG TPA: VOC family protein [Steroidobacteraceae bacterium]|jgi:predicted enzyme related to lactoylglutathione lyase|nr:VOC family protein [Steroidobacteraceae bacterium]